MPVILHPLARTTPRTRAELRAEEPALSNHNWVNHNWVRAPYKPTHIAPVRGSDPVQQSDRANLFTPSTAVITTSSEHTMS